MHNLAFSSIVFMMLAVFSAGCTPVVLAVGAGVVGGYAISRDTFEGVTAHSQEELWEAAYDVTSIMGNIQDSDRKNGEITARISGSTVQVALMPISLTNTKLRIKARKGILPRIAIAQDVYTKIINRLGE